MAQVIRFFARQALSGGSGTLNSEIFEVPDAAQIVAELRCYAISGSLGTVGVSGVIQDCMCSLLDSWRNVASAMVTGVTGLMISGTALQRYVRAQLLVNAVSGAIVSLEGVARDST
jgi:hypothetical protein